MEYQLSINIMVGLFVGAVAGYIGSLMVLKKMALVGDAFSHVALPGIGLALIFNINPFFGAFGFLALGALTIWLIETKTKLPSEAVVGVVFTLSLAVGFLIVPDAEALEALFGDISRISLFDGFLAIILSIFVFVITLKIYKKMILGTISDELSEVLGFNNRKMNLIYLLLVAIVVALGIKIVGSLLMGALVVIPAAAAKNIAGSLAAYTFLSIVIGIIGALAGIFLSMIFALPTGPLMILSSAFIFLITVVLKKNA